jgi:hypothetical protein
VIFGSSTARVVPEGPAMQVALPVLNGVADEFLLAGAAAAREIGGFTVFQSGGRLAGFAVAAAELPLEQAAAQLYRQLFAVTRGLHLARIWNYVPRINAVESGMENYRLFCRGRSLAFEQHFGAGFKKLLPAASAVGSATGPYALGFLATEAEPHHFENPHQVPAFEYPVQYGPRPPSFARATALADETGRQIFISGTAAIRGHQTVAPHDLAGQLACTVENLRLIGISAGAGNDVGAGAWQRSFKVYVRRAADFAAVQAFLQRELLQPDDAVQYLQADICRSDLLVEIEAVLNAG